MLFGAPEKNNFFFSSRKPLFYADLRKKITIFSYYMSVSLSSTQFGEIGFTYPEFAIIVAIGLQNPYVKPESGANLVLVLCLLTHSMVVVTRIKIPGIHLQYQNNAK